MTSREIKCKKKTIQELEDAKSRQEQKQKMKNNLRGQGKEGYYKVGEKGQNIMTCSRILTVGQRRVHCKSFINPDPRNVGEAMRSNHKEGWMKDISDELRVLESNGVWKFVRSSSIKLKMGLQDETRRRR